MMFNWQDSYSVGITTMDDQHKQLIGIISDLYDAMAKGKGRQILDEVFTRLEEYTLTHFRSEEKLMKLYGYPDYQCQLEQHQKFVDQLVSLRKKSASTTEPVSVQTVSFMRDWLINHILKEDKKYTAFFEGKVK